MIKFPKGFLWGAATSAHQVEGGNVNDWSDWERETALAKVNKAKKEPPIGGWEDFILNPPAGGPGPLDEENYISGRASDHYNRFEEDFDIAQKLNQNAHRFSIDWARIEPQEGKFDQEAIEHYKRVLEALRERNMAPFVTLWHWPVPLWVRDIGGWTNIKTSSFFARYAQKIQEEIGEHVEYWITLNEPLVYASNSYLKGVWPPQEKSLYKYLVVVKNLKNAHLQAYTAIKKVNDKAQVGISKNNIEFGGQLNGLKSWWWNHWFLKKIRKHQDFIGLNYYFGSCRSVAKSDMGWNTCPQGIYEMIGDLKKYNRPIYITENGIADARDVYRENFIKEHLHQIGRAIENSADVRGYFYWSLLDNFEWDKGFWPRFGLVEVNYKTMERKIRKSAHAYAEICELNQLDA